MKHTPSYGLKGDSEKFIACSFMEDSSYPFVCLEYFKLLYFHLNMAEKDIFSLAS